MIENGAANVTTSLVNFGACRHEARFASFVENLASLVKGISPILARVRRDDPRSDFEDAHARARLRHDAEHQVVRRVEPGAARHEWVGKQRLERQ